ncbi:hypothetical protein EPN96_11485 [bacterium]|nr:MAG: hypothetical protein EPN96_11485 [bacterium]
MKEKLCFVQFLHPGGESRPRKGEKQIGWNTGSHKRKFLVSPGSYIEKLEGVKKETEELCFWGEWEPPSGVTPISSSTPQNGLPNCFHFPYYVSSRPDEVQNTDPFVFGGPFLYSNCMQWSQQRGSWNSLHNLANGSVILFGSNMGGFFILDTVFVVKNSVEITGNNLNVFQSLPKSFKAATLTLLTAPKEGENFRLYFGATLEKPQDGMFSFFPAQRKENCSKGFQRPVIELNGIIANKQKQGYGLNIQTRGNAGVVKKLWEKVVNQVIEQKCVLGTYAEEPTLEANDSKGKSGHQPTGCSPAGCLRKGAVLDN